MPDPGYTLRRDRNGGRCHRSTAIPLGIALGSWLFVMRASGFGAADAAPVLGERKGAATTSSESSITRLAFGSCNKQYLPQPMWKSVEDLSPDVWLWIGDAVYVDKFSDGGVKKMREAFSKQLANEDYQRFLAKVPRVEGVWDDHDYGVNDAGKELSDHPGRVSAFLDFLGVGDDDPRRGGSTLYSSHTFGEAPKKVKVIMLDIRTQRDGYHAFNIAHRKFKFAAMIGAILRWFSSSFCLGSEYRGSVIGEDQWDWLEGQLEDSDASVHVLVSTLQVLTSNPLVESWGHFPRSRERLLDLLHRTNPPGLVILSGDVHHAELASGWKASPPTEDSSGNDNALPPGHPPVGASAEGGASRCPFAKNGGGGAAASAAGSTTTKATCDRGEKDCVPTSLGGGVSDSRDYDDDRKESGPSGAGSAECAAHSGVGGGTEDGRGVVEVTTSGMTHSCLSVHGKTMCEAYLKRWREHRWRDDAFYLDSNFGDIEIEWAEDESAPQPAKMAVTVRDVKGTPILPVIEHFGGLTDEEEDSGDGDSSRRNRRAAGFRPSDAAATGAGSGGGGAEAKHRLQEGREEERRPIERTFLDRSPPSECVEAVLPGGCTARKVSAVGVCVLALVLSYVALARGARAVSGARGKRGEKREATPLGNVPASIVAGGGSGANSKGARNGTRNGTRNGS